MIGETISHYRILDELGSGGMSVVYRAEDTRLGRQVAIKFLPATLADSPEVLERFRREARVASALNHPHICTVHDIGDHDGRQFLVMERLEGMTLQRLLATGSLPLERLLSIACDVSDALAAAHASGVIHRDVKPANIFVTARGEAKVMDFGLAKHVIAERPVAGDGSATGATTVAREDREDELLTSPGAAIGTMAYMSPEQARGEPLDGRSDVFSLGAVMYEMATGRRPFPGQTPAVVFDGILNRAPAPIHTLAPHMPQDVVNVIERALEKPRELRYQTAADLHADVQRVLRRLERQEPVPIERVEPPAVSRVGPGRLAVLAACAAVLIAAGAWGVWRARAAPALTDRDSILLGAFANTTREPVFDDTLRQALAVQLTQSPFLNIVGEERVNETLRLMGRTPGEPLAHDVAREVCRRQGVKAMIEGSITPLGTQYVIALTATACENGNVLAREQTEADRKETVLRSLGSAASRLRTRLGESLATVRNFDVPVEEATTPSLDALKAYTLGVRQRALGSELESIPFFTRAIELDPGFASAYTMLSTVYGNLGESARSSDYARHAYAHRERVSERERLSISEQYYDRVTGDIDQAIATLLLWEQSYPRDYVPSNGLAVLYSRLGDYERAAEKAREALRRNPNHPFPYSNLAYALRGLNQFAEARDVASRAAARGIETVPTRRLLYQLAVLDGDTAAAQRHLESARGRPREFDMVGAEAQVAVFRGDVERARELFKRTQDLAMRANLDEVANGYAVQAAWMELLIGSRDAVRTLARPALDSGNVQARLAGATVLALAGQLAGVPHVIDEARRSYASDTLTLALGAANARAAVDLASGRPADAVAALEPARPFELGRVAVLTPVYLRGLALLQSRQGGAAAGEFRRILAHRGVDPFSILYAFAPLGLARSLALEGDVNGASAAYEQFITRWPANVSLSIVTTARQERAALGRTD